MSRHRSLRRAATAAIPAIGLAGVMLAGTVTTVQGSSHREAPLISEDPVADLTDVYAFVNPDDTQKVTLVANVVPFEEPAGGPNFHRFGDDVLYQLHVDNNGDAKADLAYQFRFTTATSNPNTFLYNTGQVTSLDDPDLNVKQRYTVTEVNLRTARARVLGRNVPVAPANVGVRSTPDYEQNLGSAAVKRLGDGVTVFAGPRDDPFFVDLGSIFDLAGLRPFNAAHLIPRAAEAGKDYVAGYNVHSIAIELPISRLTRDGDPVIGVWATTSRRAQRVLSTSRSGVLTHKGPWVQVARLGQPLVNEVVIPLGMKDRFNASRPQDDGQFAGSVLRPELAGLIPVLYPGVTVPTDVDLGLGLGGREDLATIFLTGIPGLNQPAHVVPSEMLRLNTSIAVSQFPNGRTLADDVTDTAIRAMAGATPFTPAFNVSPNKDLGDGVNTNDRPFASAFPFLAAPASGYES